jgi:hypothetical protein
LALSVAPTSLHDSGEFDYGDFVDSDGECEVEELSEEPKDYALGYYYPICIGDVLNKTYRLEHKLGHGNFSTVWLARDISMEKYVALKIISPGKGENEYNMQNKIKRTKQNTSNILMYQTTFFLPSDKGNYHQVLVFPRSVFKLPSFEATLSGYPHVCCEAIANDFGTLTQRRNRTSASNRQERYVGHRNP